MKRFLGMKVMRGTLLLASMILVFACGRDETMASKSAAAYREAQAKGTPVTGGHEHGGHEAATASATGTMDHSAHGTGADPHAGHDMTATGTADHAAHGSMSATDHAAMGHGAVGDAHAAHGTARGAMVDHGAHTATGGAMDHAQHGSSGRTTAGHEAHGTTTGSAAHDQHAGMQHSTPTAATDPHAQHRQPTAPTTHAGHGAMQQQSAGAPSIVLKAPTTNAEIARTQPAATLRPDDFDAPAPIAVAEAQKAAAGGGGHTGHGAPSNTTADPHAGHGSASGASQQTIYTCPMHPEVTSTTPGTCPKCGMTLVKKEK